MTTLAKKLIKIILRKNISYQDAAKAINGILRIDKTKEANYGNYDGCRPTNLTNSFSWSQTEEGSNFWYNIDEARDCTRNRYVN